MNGLPENSHPDVQSVSPEDGERLLELLQRAEKPLRIMQEALSLAMARELDRSLYRPSESIQNAYRKGAASTE